MIRPALRFQAQQPLKRFIQHQNVNQFARHQSKRFASSSTPGGNKTEDALATAQKYAGEALAAGKRLLGPVGEKLGNALGSYRQPLVYNFSVTREFLKQVYLTERLQPPTSFSTITEAYSTIWSRARNPQYWREITRSGEWAKVGIYAIEAYGIFKVGEIVGRRSLVGYSLD